MRCTLFRLSRRELDLRLFVDRIDLEKLAHSSLGGIGVREIDINPAEFLQFLQWHFGIDSGFPLHVISYLSRGPIQQKIQPVFRFEFQPILSRFSESARKADRRFGSDGFLSSDDFIDCLHRSSQDVREVRLRPSSYSKFFVQFFAGWDWANGPCWGIHLNFAHTWMNAGSQSRCGCHCGG